MGVGQWGEGVVWQDGRGLSQPDSGIKMLSLYSPLGGGVVCLLSADQADINMENHRNINAEPPGKKRRCPPAFRVTSSDHSGVPALLPPFQLGVRVLLGGIP